MTDTKHMPEPWGIIREHHGTYSHYTLVKDYEPEIGQILNETNARRIVACVNACSGMIDPAAEIAALRARIEAYENGNDFTISQAQAAEWHTRLVDEEKENSGLRAELERKDARIRELEAEVAHGVLDATNRMVDARADALKERDAWKAKAERYERALCPSPDLLFGLIECLRRTRHEH